MADSQRALLPQLIRYGLTGLLSTVTHIVIAVSLIERMYVHVSLANALAFGVAVSLSYLLNTRWSFRVPARTGTAMRYLVVSAAAAALCATISGVADWLGLHYLVGIALVVVGVTPATFIAHRRWTYNITGPATEREIPEG